MDDTQVLCDHITFWRFKIQVFLSPFSIQNFVYFNQLIDSSWYWYNKVFSFFLTYLIPYLVDTESQQKLWGKNFEISIFKTILVVWTLMLLKNWILNGIGWCLTNEINFLFKFDCILLLKMGLVWNCQITNI